MCSLGAHSEIIEFAADGFAFRANTEAKVAGVINPRKYAFKYKGDIVVPSFVTYNGTTYTVTTIVSSAFYWNTTITSVTLGPEITHIESEAFYVCEKLESVELQSNHIVAIGEHAFRSCSKLTTITIPNGTDYIGGAAFSSCYNLETATIGAKRIGPNAFYACQKLKSVTFTDAVEEIGTSAFSKLEELQSVTFGNHVTTIGDGAFSGCTALSFVKLPASLKTIEYGGFGASGLTSIEMNEGLETIGGRAFQNCEYLKEAVVPNSVKTISYEAFSGCSRIERIVVGEGTETIGPYAFTNCTWLTSLTLGASIKEISGIILSSSNRVVDIYCHMPNPEAITTDRLMFDSFDHHKSKCTLHVPCGTKQAYLNLYVWQGFKDVIETCDEEPDGIEALSQAGNGSRLPTYTLSGMRIGKPEKGVNIIGGKKVVVKGGDAVK